ncbi:MAG: ABC transporter permease subunit [Anaerolineales bacterium]
MNTAKSEHEAALEALHAAKRALRQGNLAEARSSARQAAMLDPGLPDAWLILAGLAPPSAGLAYAQRALELAPDNPRAQQAVRWLEAHQAVHRKPEPVIEAAPRVESAAKTEPRPLQRKLDEPSTPRRGLLIDTWRAFRRHRAAVLGLALVAFFLGLAVFAPIFTPYDPNLGSFEHLREEPLTRFEPAPDVLEQCHWRGTPLESWGCSTFIAGTDRGGRDFYSRMVYAARTSLAVAFVASIVSLSIGITYGTVSGYAGGQVDEIMMRFVDFLYSLPVFLIVLGIQSFFSLYWRSQEGFIGWLDQINRNMGGLLFLFIAIGAVNWVGMARLSRAMVHSQKGKDYILAARSLGANEVQIILRHLLPNILGPLLVMETIAIPGYIFLEATLSFIGLGVHSTIRGGQTGVDLPSWGAMIRDGYAGLRTSPYLVLLPSLALTLLTVAFNFMGDGLRDAIDPRTRKRR